MRKLGIQDIVQLNYLLNELCHEKTGYSHMQTAKAQISCANTHFDQHLNFAK